MPVDLDDVKLDGTKVAVLVPSLHYVEAGFMLDLAQMIGFTSRHFVRDGAISGLPLLLVQGTYIHTARQDLAEAALKMGADYMLWLDTDMRFPKETLIRLLMHEKPFVGCNYPKRMIPPVYTAIKRIMTKKDLGERLVTDNSTTGLERVEAVGFGVVMTHSSVFKKIGKRPWFFYEWDKALDRPVGEDVYFCNKARKAGIRIMVDHDLSRQVRHIGSFEFDLGHAAVWDEDIKAAAAQQREMKDASGN